MSAQMSNATLFKVVRELQDKSSDNGANSALMGGLAVHVLRASIGDEPKDWKHKDIDVAVQMDQIPTFIGLLKDSGFNRSSLSPKSEHRYVYQNLICGQTVAIGIVGIPCFEVLEVQFQNYSYRILNPSILLQNAKEKWISMCKNPKIGRTVSFLENYVRNMLCRKLKQANKKSRIWQFATIFAFFTSVT